jgi:hypothetical protein
MRLRCQPAAAVVVSYTAKYVAHNDKLGLGFVERRIRVDDCLGHGFLR